MWFPTSVLKTPSTQRPLGGLGVPSCKKNSFASPTLASHRACCPGLHIAATGNKFNGFVNYLAQTVATHSFGQSPPTKAKR